MPKLVSGDPNCGLYYYVVLSILSLISFLCYVYFAKKYKLRIRDDIVPVHRLAEEYFEKEEKLRRAYWERLMRKVQPADRLYDVLISP